MKSKVTIHPFKALHTRTLLPLSLRDYAARFSLEFLVLTIAFFAFLTNFSISHHANVLETKDQSVIFSFLKSNPQLNAALFSQNNTTTILAKTDQWVASALGQSAFPGIVLASASTATTESASSTIQDNVIVKTNPADTDAFMRHGSTVYEVVSGDSIASIASSFGICPQAVMVENQLTESSTIRPGQQLTILPTCGVSHKIVSGETTSGIAAKYKISEEDLLDANDIELPDDIIAGDVLVIPQSTVKLPSTTPPRFVTDSSNRIAVTQTNVPDDFSAGPISFIWPTTTKNITQGFHGRHSGLDISNSKMEPIFAAADGIVELSGYQSGYGNTIIINHGSGFKTRYGHASELFFSAGDKVTQGQTIAKQGRTGRVYGVTGIHLHFEIIKNGVKQRPLDYVKP